jgi:hypothetical protein
LGEPLERGLTQDDRRYDEDVTATEATKADGGALGMRLVSIGELDAHREESPNLIGSETGNDIGEAWIML